MARKKSTKEKAPASRTPFRKVLVANRGEIAVRIIRSASASGIATVAVYSDADRNALHVSMADEAVRIGASEPAASYLNIEAIIAAAKAIGADAIHPGYGFLAENAQLPAACAQAGIVFVGPSASALGQMGDKARAKSIMTEAGVPCVPGYHGEDQDNERLLEEARKIGWPVMIKAVAGGGGRGMRLVESEVAFAEDLESARSEASTAFGDDRLLLEKAIVNPRHVEIQIVADRYGNAVHLGERDCSVQRRHQKIIEESPSPAVSADLREEMGTAAIRAALAIGYEGAGTLEFLLAENGEWYFMEMNTRLQVEHPVTEAITGLDLVAMQLHIAGGEPLDLKQEDVRFSGHAIEARLCAEDPENDFMPQSGRIEVWRTVSGIRTDHALFDGAEIPPHYDSMIAKLIAQGRDREEARRKLLSGLNETVALGVSTNQAFLADCLGHPVFAAGEATTSFVKSHATELLGKCTDALGHAASVAALILRAAPNTGLAHGFEAPIRLACDDVIIDRRVRAGPLGTCEIRDDAGELLLRATVESVTENAVVYREGDITRKAVFCRDDDRLVVQIGAASWDFADHSFHAETADSSENSDGKVRASLTGRVVAVDVTEGEQVAAGQTVAVVEAMKMEHAHRSAIAGKVTAVHVAPGDQVAARDIMVEIETG